MIFVFLGFLHSLPSQAHAQAHPFPLCLTGGIYFDQSCNTATQGTPLKHLCLGPMLRSVSVSIVSPLFPPGPDPEPGSYTRGVSGPDLTCGCGCGCGWHFYFLILIFAFCVFKPDTIVVFHYQYWARQMVYIAHTVPYPSLTSRYHIKHKNVCLQIAKVGMV